MSSAFARPPDLRFAPNVRNRMWSRVWPALAFYLLAMPAAGIRAIADDVGMPVRRNFHAVEAALLTDAPTRWLQGSFVDIEFTRMAAAAIYFTWFFAPITTGLGVLLFRPHDYWRFIAFLLLLYYAIVPFFVLYPLEAPWAHDAGIHRFVAEAFPEMAAQDPNPYAAMPSLHVALTAAAALWYGLRSFWGRIVLAYSLLISAVVVLGGEHYAADVIGGYALAAATYGAARWLKLPVFASASASKAPSPLPLKRQAPSTRAA